MKNLGHEVFTVACCTRVTASASACQRGRMQSRRNCIKQFCQHHGEHLFLALLSESCRRFWKAVRLDFGLFNSIFRWYRLKATYDRRGNEPASNSIPVSAFSRSLSECPPFVSSGSSSASLSYHKPHPSSLLLHFSSDWLDFVLEFPCPLPP